MTGEATDSLLSPATIAALGGEVLKGIRVLDLGAFITGPYAAMLLADLGAEVVKVEPPNGGDPFRGFDSGGYSPAYQAHNRNKLSVSLDYRTPEGLEILERLARTADVLVINSRPGVPERGGYGPKRMAEINPNLIYCQITGFGPVGPYAQRPAFDNVGQALSGWLTLFQMGGDPRVAGPAVCDAVTGLFAAYGVLGALFERARTGRARLVEVNMVEAMLAFASEPIIRYRATGTVSGPFSRAAMSQAFALTCRDGLGLGIHLSSPEKFWTALMKAIDAPEVAEDSRFLTRQGRVDHYNELAFALKAVFARRDRAEWLARLEASDVPFAPIHDVSRLAEDPHLETLQTFYTDHHPERGEVAGINRPVYYDGNRDISRRPPPVLGENSSEILRELGISEATEASLRKRGVV